MSVNKKDWDVIEILFREFILPCLYMMKCWEVIGVFLSQQVVMFFEFKIS